jgi:Tfp pilus assembly protein PilF
LEDRSLLISAEMLRELCPCLNQRQIPCPPSALLFQSALNLSVGKVEAATGLLEKAKAGITTGYADRGKLQAAYFSQKAVIALVQNEKDSALNLAKKATSATSKSVSAAVIRGYVHQGRLELDLSREWLLKALEIQPDNPLALARLAELELGAGRLEEGVEMAAQAVKASPNDAYALSVLGYAHLTRYEVESAQEYFERAIEIDDGSGLPYLGLGLAKIRSGALEEGRGEIEKAAQLEPNIALYRSYLGKAFFEEEDEDLAEKEYGLAIDLDPEDPTPYLYRAFNSLSKNRPVDALEDIEDSIARNENRAVYRSSFLLDQDLAVRGTSLGEVFNQLGFSRIAQLEAMKSINHDYSNYSAHRLLAQSYTGDFFADAEFTENVIADLLAPVSFNVFQNLSGFSGAASLNEYSALFDRPEHRTGLALSGASHHDVYGGNVFGTGKVDNFGYYTGYRTTYGRGRKSGGNFMREHRFDLAAQQQLNYDNRLFFQTAFTRVEDKWEEDGYELDDYEVAVGSHHKFGPHSQVLLHFEHFNRSMDDYELFIPREVQQSLIVDDQSRPLDESEFTIDQYSEDDFRTLRYSAQYIYDSDLLSAVLGGQILDSRIDSNEDSVILDDLYGVYTGLDTPLLSTADYRGISYSSYLYTTWHLASWVDANLGLNYTEIELPQYDVIPPYVDGERSEDRLSPKVGLSFYPLSNLTVRSAYFRSLGISSISDIGTIEPTLVGSFSQVFGDLPGAKTETFAVGFDHKLPKQLYWGVEFMYRDIEREVVDISNSVVFDLDNLEENEGFNINVSEEKEREDILRSYFYYVINKRTTGTIDYTRTVLDTPPPQERNETDRLSFGLNYFATQRWFSFTRAGWWNQDLENVFGFEDGNENFWLVDIGAGYRIPKRHGAVRFVLRNLLDEDFDFDDRGREAAIYSGFNFGFEASVNF